MVVAEVCSTMKYPKRCQYKHAKQKKYHVRNWAEYNEGLRRRGDLTVWFDEEALLHGPEQIADLPVPVVESPGAVRIGHPERGHLVEYLAPNSVFQLVASPTFVSASRAR